MIKTYLVTSIYLGPDCALVDNLFAYELSWPGITSEKFRSIRKTTLCPYTLLPQARIFEKQLSAVRRCGSWHKQHQHKMVKKILHFLKILYVWLGWVDAFHMKESGYP